MNRKGWLHRSRPMKRSSISRKSPMKRKPRRKRAGEDPAYLARVRELGCYLEIPPSFGSHCSGAIEAHHAGPRPGIGLKCSDYLTHPFCRGCHAAWHGGYGVFRGWKREDRRRFADEAIAWTQARLIWKAAA